MNASQKLINNFHWKNQSTTDTDVTQLTQS